MEISGRPVQSDCTNSFTSITNYVTLGSLLCPMRFCAVSFLNKIKKIGGDFVPHECIKNEWVAIPVTCLRSRKSKMEKLLKKVMKILVQQQKK